VRWRFATLDDARLLATLNRQLIEDEGHRNPMEVDQLEQRMRGWLATEYRAVLFQGDSEVLAYALFRDHDAGCVCLRHFFVTRGVRRLGVGGRAMQLFQHEVVPPGTRIAVEVLASNHGGRSFWAAVGFREYAVTLERT
jgi:GNAT superfamily N-acetyltransferase